MKLVYIGTALVGALATGLVTQLRYGALVSDIPQLLAAGDSSANVVVLSSQAWVGPSLLIPGLALLIGIVAAGLAPRGDAVRRWAGARLGMAAGLGALVAVTALFAALFAALGGDPAVQAFVQASEPHPEARLAADLIPWVSAGIGAILGLVIGAESFAAAIFGGAVVDVVRERSAPARPQPVS